MPDRLARSRNLDVQISRIRLSDKTSRLRPRHVTPERGQAYEPEVIATLQLRLLLLQKGGFGQFAAQSLAAENGHQTLRRKGVFTYCVVFFILDQIFQPIGRSLWSSSQT